MKLFFLKNKKQKPVFSINEAIIQTQKYAFLPYVNKQAVLRGQLCPRTLCESKKCCRVRHV